MKILIAYYSRSGHNRKLSEELAKALSADVEEIIDLKSRDGIVGWIIGGKDASTKQLTNIKPVTKNPADYDLVILSSPLWVGTAAPAIRQFIVQNKEAFKKIAFASVCGSNKPQGSIDDIEKLSGLKLFSTLYISDAEFKGNYQDKIDAFINSIA